MITIKPDEIDELRSAVETIEAAVNLRGTTPTRTLLEAVSEWVELRTKKPCSLTAAWCYWWAVSEIIERLRRKYEKAAEIGHWLNIDATEINSARRLALWQNIPRIKAQQRIANGQFDGTDYQGVYHLVLLATGDEAQARKAQADAAERYVDMKMGKT